MASTKENAEYYVKLRTQQIHDVLTTFQNVKRGIEGLMSISDFAKSEAERRSKNPSAQYANDIDGEITGICFCFSGNDDQTARLRLINYFQDRCSAMDQNTPGAYSRWQADEIGMTLARGFFPEDESLGMAVVEFMQKQNPQE